MAHPFLPMTTELLKNLTRANQDSGHTINFPDFPDFSAVCESQEFKSAFNLKPERSETDQSNLRTDNRN